MSDSWRITVSEIDRSQTVNASPGNTGAMVIRASKGPVKPVYVSTADEKRIIDIFGKPSSSYPDVWEVIQFNKAAPLWISAPYDATATLGGVVVGANGTRSLNASDGIDPDSLTSFTFGGASEYFVLAAISPYSDDLGVKVSYNSVSDLFTVQVYITEDSGTTWTYIAEYVVSETAGTKDGYNANVFVEEIFGDDPLTNDYLQAYANTSANVSSNGFTDDAAVVPLGGGARGSAITITEMTTGWNYFQSPRTYAADIFMDSTADDGIPTLFNTLRDTYQKYATYIIALPDNESYSTAITTKQNYSINNRGLAFYWNHGRVRDTYNDTSFWTSLIGCVGYKLARMVDVYNGLAPSWANENGHGGQLSGFGILEMRYDPSEDNLETLDDNGINPIIFDPGYGVMIVSQRTAKTPQLLSDDSWIAHSRLFDYIISNVKEQVLVYQITKLNDTTHRQIAAAKADQIIAPIAALGIIADYGVQCNTANNTAQILADRKFVLTVAVKVTVFSEKITFNFVKVGQTLEVSQFIG